MRESGGRQILGHVVPRERWAKRLQEFTNRNASRLTSIEIDDPSIGAQEQESDYPLRGVAYDAHDRTIEIMLGELEGVPHLTHTIEQPTEVEILSRPDGRDDVLRVGHPGGQTLLRLH